MILVDTSRWVDHFRAGDPQLAGLLEEGLVGAHAFVIGELACGNLKDRAKTLDFFMRLPRISGATDSEVHHCVEAHRLWGLGLGWVDLHLLTAAAISGWSLLTADRALTAAAAKLGLRSGR